MTESDKIKQFALTLGFDACGICRAESSGEEANLRNWISMNYQGDMSYLERNIEKRDDPRLLVPGAKSIISVALNYYPNEKRDTSLPKFAYYAYGKDYHYVVKEKLRQLFNYIKSIYPDTEGRYFCDTAPVLEGYWAVKAGLGFVGKNTLLIIPGKGSFFFLGELIINKELDYDEPINLSCGTCTRCLDACPTGAIEQPHLVNATRCISYQTIEKKGAQDNDVSTSDWVYGCDVCQLICPWNRFSKPHTTPEFNPSPEFLSLDLFALQTMDKEKFSSLFSKSAIKRAKLKGLQRNVRQLTKK
ncbi:MAG TPA: tRNA epoxyqueuosine(34) reductase QueG [Dysgonamonadaceae bacterium]|nr:tRNA epoxyqueuosine(34) reductase QueG [Dysgonamonadaceae bacterium]